MKATKSGIVRARVGQADLASMHEIAGKLGLSLSGWVRMVILKELIALRSEGHVS